MHCVKELIDINRYLHDFTSAMWICGSILLWLMLRESRRGVSAEVVRTLGRLSATMVYVTVPSLIVSLASGGVRAMTFEKYEHVGEVTSSVITMLPSSTTINSSYSSST